MVQWTTYITVVWTVQMDNDLMDHLSYVSLERPNGRYCRSSLPLSCGLFLVSCPRLDGRALCPQLRVVLHHNSIVQHGHYLPWLGISCAITPRCCTPHLLLAPHPLLLPLLPGALHPLLSPAVASAICTAARTWMIV